MGLELTSTTVLKRVEPVKLLVLGGGYTGSRLAAVAARLGISGVISHRQIGTRPSTRASLGAADWQLVGFDSDNGVLPGAETLEGITHVVSTIPPDRHGDDPVLTRLAGPLQDLQPRWLGYLSTTGVYGDPGGAWVDEGSPCRPGLELSRARRRCEQAWQATGLPLQIFRLPAIYGPGRNPVGDLRAGRSRLLHRPGQVFCRVHVDDICGALLHCLSLPAAQRPPVVNVVDDAPCPASEQLGYAAHLLGCKLPPVQPFATARANLSPMALSFWQENRRVSNALLCQQLGYRLRYPSYREGLRAALAEEGAQPEGVEAGSAT
jgi:hypothetical protein